MENFVVSARKYRPQTFDSVVGQSAITGTLQNAIENNHLAQAFLFCGPRGVGKTSCARILAREINIHAAREKNESTDIDFSLNTFELDAASNNSVDDIRNLTDQVRFAPQVGTFKVYIIDEVHMLSPAAFNAFLKTLEEPPPHAIFILATTEKHKIIPTILSRCQIFDFQRITVKDIALHLSSIAEQEGVQAESEGLNIIAEKADGAMRDALSMFDQLVSFSGNELTYDAVIENLNVLDYDYYFRIVDHVLGHRIPDSLMVFDEILNKGFDGHNFIVGLAQHLRNLMVCKNAHTIKLIETSDAIRERYEKQSENCTVRFIFKALEALNDADVQYKSSKNQRLLVELALMRLCAIPSEKKSKPSRDERSESQNSGEKGTQKQNLTNETLPARAPEAQVQKAAPQTRESAPVDSSESRQPPAPAEKPSPPPTPTSEPEPKAESVETDAAISKKQPVSTSSNKSAAVADTSEEKVIPVNKTEQRKKFMAKFQSASVSISAGLQESGQPEYGSEAQQESPEAKANRPHDAFSAESLKNVWDEYAEQVRANGRQSLFSTLTSRPPEIRENHQLHLLINNSAQELELNREKGDLLDYLREKLNNYSIEIVFEIQTIDQPTGLYTNSQKFEAMVKKNPNLGKLSGNLNLDIF